MSEQPPREPEPEEDHVATLLQVGKRFMVPFLLSWAFALVGSKLDLEWLYYIGLAGVGLSTTGLLLWLIH